MIEPGDFGKHLEDITRLRGKLLRGATLHNSAHHSTVEAISGNVAANPINVRLGSILVFEPGLVRILWMYRIIG